MKKEEIKRIRKSVNHFLKSNENVLVLECNDTCLNPTKYYHMVLLSNPLLFFLKSCIITICTILPASEFKNFWYRFLGMKIGKNVSISAGVIFDIGYPQLISIKDGTIIGTKVKILTHETTIKKIRIGRVIIGKQSLVGVGSIIRSGSIIGDYAVVGAGSFVNRNVKKREFVGGVPIKRIKFLKGLV
jgi:acetyltransferase-like isoleucine patch superfamily enzyme